MNLLTPKSDLVFKLLFTADTDLLINLINSVLNLPEERLIISVEIRNPEILPDEITRCATFLPQRTQRRHKEHK